MITDLRAQLDEMDLLAGCTPRTVLSLEASWPEIEAACGVSWREAYDLALQRANMEAADARQGRVVSFLEGMAATALTQAGRGEHV